MRIASIWVELRLVLGVFVIGLIFGFFTGHWALCTSIALFAFIVWQLRQMMHLRHWLAAGAPLDNLPNLSGSAYQIITQISDIKKLELEEKNNLQTLLAQFDAATKAMPDAMIIVDASQYIEWSNAASKTILNIDPDKDIGQHIGNIVRDPEIGSYLESGDYSEPLEFSSLGSSEKDLILRVMLYADSKKLLVIHDHSNLMRLQNVRKAFVSNASHEMRTPLTVIIGYLEALSLREAMDEATRRGVVGALEQAQRLKQLIEDLLSLSRLERQPLNNSEIESINAEMLVSEAIELVKSSDIYKQQRVDVQLEEVLIHGNYRELQSAVQNILDNAVKYSAPDTHIEVSWSLLSEGGSILTISDHGDGIESSHIPRLTERFYRIDKGRSRDMGGTGLGLSIVKHVMERHGGELRITSQMGAGTRVQLYFPSQNNEYNDQRVSA